MASWINELLFGAWSTGGRGGGHKLISKLISWKGVLEQVETSENQKSNNMEAKWAT